MNIPGFGLSPDFKWEALGKFIQEAASVNPRFLGGVAPSVVSSDTESTAIPPFVPAPTLPAVFKAKGTYSGPYSVHDSSESGSERSLKLMVARQQSKAKIVCSFV